MSQEVFKTAITLILESNSNKKMKMPNIRILELDRKIIGRYIQSWLFKSTHKSSAPYVVRGCGVKRAWVTHTEEKGEIIIQKIK